MPSLDPDELRQAAGEGAAKSLDVIDDDLMAIFEELLPPVERLLDHLEERGMTARERITYLVSMAIGAASGHAS